MLDLLRHLLPDFTRLTTGEPASLVLWFWIVMFTILLVSLLFVIRHYRLFKARVNAVEGLLAEQTPERLPRGRLELRERAEALKVPGLAALWRDFDRSLVLSPNQQHLYASVEAEHFFNARRMAPGLTASRLLAAAPSFLVAIGVLGTFVGLTIGLVDLQVRASEVEELKIGIDHLIAGAAVAFMTSVWGVFFSLLLNMIEKLFERSALWRLQDLNQKIDGLFPRLPLEQSLLQMADYGRRNQEALQGIEQRLGRVLEESMNGLGHQLRDSLGDTIGPAIAKMAQSVNEQAARNATQLDETLRQFADNLEKTGEQQARSLRESAGEVGSAVAGMNTQFADFMQTLESQRDQQAQLLSALSRASEAIAESSRHLDSGADSLGALADTLRETLAGLETGMETITARIETIGQHSQSLAERQAEQLAALEPLQQAMSEAAERLRAASGAAQEGFSALSEHQQAFLGGLDVSFTQLGSGLRAQIEQMEQQAERWLQNYSETVNSQLEERMQAWNRHTLQFVDEMTRTVQALSHLVDELEARRR